MIDCHCHLCDNSFKEDINIVIDKAIESGVRYLIVVPEYSDQVEKVMELSRQRKTIIFPSIGVHPIQKRNKSVQMKHLELILPLLERYHEDIVCIGEIGLDFSERYKLSEEQKKMQIEVFIKQLELAEKYNLPVNIHSRQASLCTLSILSKFNVCVLLHAFDGNEESIDESISRGYYLSIPPAFTLSKQGNIIVNRCPISQLVLESDSPSLGIQKGRNEPSSINISALFISNIKDIPIDEVIHITSSNASTLFNRLPSL